MENLKPVRKMNCKRVFINNTSYCYNLILCNAQNYLNFYISSRVTVECSNLIYGRVRGEIKMEILNKELLILK